MARRGTSGPRRAGRFPHARGDGPKWRNASANWPSISPRAWGWPASLGNLGACLSDFPTRVGMARGRAARGPFSDRFPHARGDGPHRKLPTIIPRTISPRAWGWPVVPEDARPCGGDFPTRVGMARRSVGSIRLWTRFPHARGDGPARGDVVQVVPLISPRAWGWPGRYRSDRSQNHSFPKQVGTIEVHSSNWC